MGTFWKYAFFPILANLLLAGWVVGRDPGWYGLKGLAKRVECLAGVRAVTVQGISQGFPAGKAPAQQLVQASPQATRLEKTDTPGWTHYAVPEGAATQTLVFAVEPQGESLTFFPRASGEASRVEAAVMDGGKPDSITVLAGKPDVWTPIGARWTLSLECVRRGAPVTVRVTLSGPWAQLWVRNGEAFFNPQ